METLETERLILRPLCEDDYLDCFKWCGDARVNEFMIYPLYHNAEDVKEWLKTVNDDEKSMCFGYVLKETVNRSWLSAGTTAWTSNIGPRWTISSSSPTPLTAL